MLTALVLFTFILGGYSPAHAQRVRAASGGLSIIHSLLWAVYDQNLMKKYGVDMEYIAIENEEIWRRHGIYRH